MGRLPFAGAGDVLDERDRRGVLPTRRGRGPT